jgi:hypothetical protein
MTYTLLSMMQQVMAELGLPQPTAVATSTDPQLIQFYNLFQLEATELRQSHPWTALQTLWIIQVTNPLTVLGDIASGSTSIINLSSTATFSVNPTTYLITDSAGLLPVSTRLVSVNAALSSLVLDSQANGAATQATLTIMKDTYAMPTDFSHYIGTTWWDRTNRWALLGPDSPQIDQWHRSGIYVTGPRRHFRQIGQNPNNWRIWPPLSTASTTAQELVFEYMTKNTILISGGTATAELFANDGDVPILDPQAIMLGVKWRWLQAKRYQYADHQQEYLDYVDRLKARDGGNRIQSLSPEPAPDYITPSSTPDGFWPGNATISGQ